MRLSTFPYDVAIGGLDAQADVLSRDAARAAQDAEALIRLVRIGDPSWRAPTSRTPSWEPTTWRRSAAGC